ncbi:MAG TPA: CHASE4 domain-containing protein [Planctomycetota bacterium]|nr:CHASE4 domain-containing protein [Planctomycetota bacterium]
MLLRSKMVLILSAVVVLYAVVDHAAQRVLITPSFSALEREEAREDLQRTVDAIKSEIQHLDMRCLDWSAWDDTYRFVAAPPDAEPDQAYIDSNLGRKAVLGDHADLLFICKPGGEVVWSDITEPGSVKKLAMRSDFPREALSPSHPLLAENAAAAETAATRKKIEPENGKVSGLVMTEHGPMMIASRAILTSAGTGPMRGTLIMGKFLGPAMIKELERQTSVRFDVWPMDGGAIPERELARLDEITSTTEFVVAERDDELVDVYTTIEDIQHAPALLLRANVERAISARGSTSIRYALISTMAAGLLLLLVLLGVLQKTVLAPIALLTNHAVDMGKQEDASVKLELKRDDEIGILSREFDDMLEKLAQSRAAVVEAARAAGKSEVATGILHNVGNVLNTVNVSATLVADRVRNSRVAKLQRLVSVVEQHPSDLGEFIARDPKGKHFGPYLTELAKLMTTDQETIEREVVVLNSGIEHIRELVDSQQSYAKRSELREPTRVAPLLDSALKISEQALVDCRKTEVVREYEDLPAMPLDKHKLLEILVNLLKNARESMQRSNCETPRLVVALRRAGADRFRIEITDNGQGIAAESLTRIFSHGFTTHAAGHGFGLHGAANSVTEMGGKLTAQSQGVGFGAVFTLELPAVAPIKA